MSVLHWIPMHIKYTESDSATLLVMLCESHLTKYIVHQIA